jgi:chitin synthase
VHDVSWGTKGDNKVQTDLGTVKTSGGDNKQEVEVEVTDKDAAYEDALQNLRTKPPKVESKPDASTMQEDYYRNFRTNVLLAWTLSNVSSAFYSRDNSICMLTNVVNIGSAGCSHHIDH